LGIQYRKEAATTAAQRAAQQKSEFELKAAQRKFGEDLKLFHCNLNQSVLQYQDLLGQ
jgi:hypothetical protein